MVSVSGMVVAHAVSTSTAHTLSKTRIGGIKRVRFCMLNFLFMKVGGCAATVSASAWGPGGIAAGLRARGVAAALLTIRYGEAVR